MSAQLAVIFSYGIWGFEGWGANISFLHPHLHPEEMGLDPNQGLKQFHQLDLGEKHSSIPEKRSHNYRSSGNRRRLMKCRLVLRREGEGGRAREKTQNGLPQLLNAVMFSQLALLFVFWDLSQSVYSFSQRLSSTFKFNKSLLFMALEALITSAKKYGGIIFFPVCMLICTCARSLVT